MRLHFSAEKQTKKYQINFSTILSVAGTIGTQNRGD